MRYTGMLAAGLLATSLLTGGCAHPRVAEAGGYLPYRPATELAHVPFFPQQAWQCGPAALATALTASGAPKTADALVPEIYIPDRRGSLQPEIIAASRRAGRLPWVIEPTLDGLLAELEAGRPVVVLQNLLLAAWPKWHYAVVVGYDPDRQAVILRSGTRRRVVSPVERFMRTWKLAGNWGLVTLPPGVLPARTNPERFMHALTDMAAVSGVAAPGLELAYTAAVGRWPGHPTVLFAAANRAYEQGRLHEARLLYERALQLEPGHAAARNNYANLLAAQGCRSEALRQAHRARSGIQPEDPLAGAIHDTVRSLSTGPADDDACPAGADGEPVSEAASRAQARSTSRG